MLSNIEQIENANIKEYSNMKVGGVVKKIYFPKNEKEALEIFNNEDDIFIMGNGTNILFADEYLPINVINFVNYKEIEILEKNDEKVLLKATAGVDFKEFIEFLKKNNLHGLENMTGIPGSLGGMVAMNAGAYGTEIFDYIKYVNIITKDGEFKTLKKEDLNYSYRTTDIRRKNMIVISVAFEFSYGFNLEDSEDKINQRKTKHPLELPNLGSTFKNPKNEFAAQIISDLGLKNYTVGQACISSKHPNFITNLGDAKFQDVIDIIDYVKKEVKDKRNIDLETEIIIMKNENGKEFKHHLVIKKY